MGNYNPDSHRLPRTMSLRYSGLSSTCLLFHHIRFVKQIMNGVTRALFPAVRIGNDRRFLDGFTRNRDPVAARRLPEG